MIISSYFYTDLDCLQRESAPVMLRPPSHRLLAIIQDSHTDTACQQGEVIRGFQLIKSRIRKKQLTELTYYQTRPCPSTLHLLFVHSLDFAHFFLFIKKYKDKELFTSFFSLVVSFMASFKSAIVLVAFSRFSDASL